MNQKRVLFGKQEGHDLIEKLPVSFGLRKALHWMWYEITSEKNVEKDESFDPREFLFHDYHMGTFFGKLTEGYEMSHPWTTRQTPFNTRAFSDFMSLFVGNATCSGYMTIEDKSGILFFRLSDLFVGDLEVIKRQQVAINAAYREEKSGTQEGTFSPSRQ